MTGSHVMGVNHCWVAQEGISECWEVKESGNGIIYNGITQKHEVTPALMTTPIRSTF